MIEGIVIFRKAVVVLFLTALLFYFIYLLSFHDPLRDLKPIYSLEIGRGTSYIWPHGCPERDYGIYYPVRLGEEVNISPACASPNYYLGSGLNEGWLRIKYHENQSHYFRVGGHSIKIWCRKSMLMDENCEIQDIVRNVFDK